MRRYSDAQLTEAVYSATSWRGVLRELGLTATSASAIRSVRMHANRLGLDHSHFRGQRRWTDQQLVDAVAAGRSWAQVAELLGLAGGSSTTTLRGHAARLNLDVGHIAKDKPSPTPGTPLQPLRAHLGRAGALLAAAWFELSGCSVSWPLEPCRYDLLVWMNGTAQRVQVKTATVKQGTSFTAWISTTGGLRRKTYDPDEIDHFFVIDGDFAYYLIPASVVGGLTAIQLSAYEHYRLTQIPHHGDLSASTPTVE